MQEINIREAKAEFSSVCNRAHAGETFLITKNGEPWANVTPINTSKRRFGSIKGVSGEVDIDAFNEPLEDQAALWEGDA